MESNTKLKISYIISVVDYRKKYEPTDFKWVLDDESRVPSKIINKVGKDSHFTSLKEIHDQYIKYDFDYVNKTLCGFRTFDDICEVSYITSINYVPNLNKAGRIIAIGELQDFNIFIEDYYGELFAKFGGKAFA